MPVSPMQITSNNPSTREIPIVNIRIVHSNPTRKINKNAGICISFTSKFVRASSCALHFPFFAFMRNMIFKMYKIMPNTMTIVSGI